MLATWAVISYNIYYLSSHAVPPSPPSSRFVFAKNCHDTGLISDLEWSVYCDWHGFLLEALPLKFDAFIYLRTNPQVDVSGGHERTQESGLHWRWYV